MKLGDRFKSELILTDEDRREAERDMLAARHELYKLAARLRCRKPMHMADAYLQVCLDPLNADIVKQAEEPRKPRKRRQKLSGEEIEKRLNAMLGESDFQQLDGRTNDIRKGNGRETEVTPVRKTDGTIDELATAIKHIHKSGGTRVGRR